jgi:hypothetical protein
MLVLSDWRVQVSNPGADWLYSSSDKSCCRMSGEFKWQILQRSSWDKCWCWVTMESSRDKCWCEWLWRVQVTNPAAEFKRQMLVLSDWRVQVTNAVHTLLQWWGLASLCLAVESIMGFRAIMRTKRGGGAGGGGSSLFCAPNLAYIARATTHTQIYCMAVHECAPPCTSGSHGWPFLRILVKSNNRPILQCISSNKLRQERQ